MISPTQVVLLPSGDYLVLSPTFKKTVRNFDGSILEIGQDEETIFIKEEENVEKTRKAN